MNNEKFFRCEVVRLENELSATKAELAALKASIPQIQHDAIMRVGEYGCSLMTDGSFGKTSKRIIEDAKNLLTQAKD